MIPLTTWTCDTCSGQITDPNMSLVVWREESGKLTDYKIVHKVKCDPGAGAGYEANLELSNFLGPDGAAMLLSWLSLGPIVGPKLSMPRVGNFEQFVDLFRRVQTPYYEEARRHFREPDVQHSLSDASESYPYRPEVLQRIAEGKLG